MMTVAAAVRFSLRVRYGEVDLQGFVFNANYLLYADVAMTEYFRELGWGYPELLAEGCDPSLVASNVEFKSPARLDEELTIDVSCERVGNSSFTLAVEISRDQEAIASVRNTYVNVDTNTEKAQAVPEPIRTAITARGPLDMNPGRKNVSKETPNA